MIPSRNFGPSLALDSTSALRSTAGVYRGFDIVCPPRYDTLRSLIFIAVFTYLTSKEGPRSPRTLIGPSLESVLTVNSIIIIINNDRKNMLQVYLHL